MKFCICSPPWEVLLLVAHCLDPKTLAISSCVSRSWSISMSSDHLWKPICSAHFPSLCSLRAADPNVPYHRLYAICYVSLKRRLWSPTKPRLSLDDVVFAIDVRCRDSRIVTIAKPACELEPDPNGLFRFDMDVCAGFEISAESGTTRPSRIRLEASRYDSDTRYPSPILRFSNPKFRPSILFAGKIEEEEEEIFPPLFPYLTAIDGPPEF